MNIANLSIKRKAGSLYIHVKLSADMAKLFAGTPGDTRGSTSWKNSKGEAINFYSNNLSVGRRLNLVTNRFGEGLFVDGYTNASILRAVDIQTGVTFSTREALYTKDELTQWCNEMGLLLKRIHQEYVRPIEIKLEVTEGEPRPASTETIVAAPF